MHMSVCNSQIDFIKLCSLLPFSKVTSRVVLSAFITHVTVIVTGTLQLSSLDIVLFGFTLAAFVFFLRHLLSQW